MSAAPIQTMEEMLKEKPRSLWYYSWKRLKRNRLAMGGLIVTFLIILIAAFASFLAPFDPNLQVLEYATKPTGFKGNVILRTNELQGKEPIPIPIQSFTIQGDQMTMITDDGNTRKIAVSKLVGTNESDWHKEPTYYLGTDRYGRDVFSRLMYGARVSLTVAFFSELLSIVIGVLLGAIAGFYRGWIDDFIMWFTNVVWSVPPILLVIAISIALGLGFI
ncbi:MAG: hypothetical protein Q8916_12350, partial [Bacteroidota bacterium]|nr:hypothetical protein [Bacteroidota bacterium]